MGMSIYEERAELQKKADEISQHLIGLAHPKKNMADITNKIFEVLDTCRFKDIQPFDDSVMKIVTDALPPQAGESELYKFHEHIKKNCDRVFRVMAFTTIDKQIEHFKKTKEIGYFYERVKKALSIYSNATDKNLRESYYYWIKKLDDFHDLLRQLDSAEKERKAIPLEVAHKTKELLKIMGKIGKIDYLLRYYSKPEVYSRASASAAALLEYAEKSRTKKLEAITKQLGNLIPEYEKLEFAVRNAVNIDYKHLHKAYEILHKFKFVLVSNDYKDILYAKKSLLDSCKNDDPEKEIGLFRNAVSKLNYHLEKNNAADVLAALRHIDEITVLNMQHHMALEEKIDLLTKQQELLGNSLQ